MIFLIFMSVITAACRLFVPRHDATMPLTYEAFAHIWVGVLATVAVLSQKHRSLSMILLITITALEAFMFFHQR